MRFAQRLLTLLPIALVVITGCRGLDPVASQDMARGAGEAATISAEESLRPPSTEAIEAAINNPRRSAVDRQRDEQRRADKVLEFFGIAPGMTVLDLFSGGGYYTELLSFAVGPAGKVVAHNNTPYAKFAEAEIAERFNAGRLPNVERLLGENNALDLPENTFDAVLMILAYHDVYFADDNMGWDAIDSPMFLAEVYRSMKPGAVLGVVDHVAQPGASVRSAQDLHRIDPEIVKRDIAAAGFIFDGSSDILRNPADDRSRSVFAETIRGKTDRAVLRFKKPASNDDGG